MRKSRFTESPIVSILKELDTGTPATKLAREHGIQASHTVVVPVTATVR